VQHLAKARVASRPATSRSTGCTTTCRIASAGQRRGAGAADALQFLDELALWSDAAKIR